MSRPIAVVTGASSGIGAATARALSAAGFDVVCGARRAERIDSLAGEIGGRAHVLDVTDQASVDEFAAFAGEARVLVNNAGGARGLGSVAGSDDEQWRWMWETNVLGVVRMTRAMLPALERSGDGLIVNVGSTAALDVYAGGAGYTSSKHALLAVTQTMRLELLGKPVRVTEVDPGLVKTEEFSLRRFDGDAERAEKVYEGIDALTADDVADIVAYVATRPSRVNIDQVVVRPRDQANSTSIFRR